MGIARRTWLWGGLLSALSLVCSGCASVDEEAEAAYQEGLQKLQGGDVPGAMKSFDAGLAAHPGHLEMRFRLGQLQLDAAHPHYEAARSKEREAESTDGADTATQLQQEARERRGRAEAFYRAARENFIEVIDGADDDRRVARAHFLKMRCELLLGDHEQAAADLEKFIEIGKPSLHETEKCRLLLDELRGSSGLRPVQ